MKTEVTPTSWGNGKNLIGKVSLKKIESFKYLHPEYVTVD